MAAMENSENEKLTLHHVEYFVSQGADVNAKGKHNWTPLHTVAGTGHVDIIEFLIAQGADVNAKTDIGFTPLHWAAAWNEDVEVAKFLVSKGADVNVQAKYVQFSGTPLAWATKNKNTAVVEYLSGLK